MSLDLEFSDRAGENLKGFRKRDQQIVLDARDVRWTSEPDRPTRNRKTLEEDPLAPWELRAGDSRIFFDIAEEQTIVIILAIGRKVHNTLVLGGEEIES